MIGIQRALEDVPPWSERKYPIYAKDFQTRVTPHHHGRGIHRLMPFTDGSETLSSPEERQKNILKYPQYVTMWSAWFQELSLKYFTPLRFDADLYVSRAEWGPKSGNPHFHQVTFSNELSEFVFNEIEKLQEVFENLCQDAISSGQSLNDVDTQAVLTAELYKRFECLKTVYGKKMSKYYSQWNPGLTRDGKNTTFDFDRTRENIPHIDMAVTVHTALATGDFGKVDFVYTSVLNQTCRHTMHKGRGGKPAKTDYCCSVDRKIDKSAMEKQRLESGKRPPKIYKPDLKCKRRFPRKIRRDIEIHPDPYNKKLTQLSLPCNDKWLNGGDPFSTLVWLHNHDDKNIIPPPLVKKPVVDWRPCSECPTNLPSLVFYEGTSDLAADYILKYQFKAPVSTKLPAEMLIAATESMNPSDQVNLGVLQSVQNTVSLATHTCVFEALHVNYGFPLVMSNMEAKPINTAGLQILHQDYTDADGNNYTTGTFPKFDNRMQDPESINLKNVQPSDFQRPMCVNEYYDRFNVSERRPTPDNPERRMTISKKRAVKAGKLQLCRCTPHCTISKANPASPDHSNYCKWMVLYRKPMLLTDDVLKLSEAQRENVENYWRNLFYTSFPKGEGLPPYAKRWFRKFHPDEFVVFLSDSSSSDESDVEIDNQNPGSCAAVTNSESQDLQDDPLARRVNEHFFQDDIDKIRNPDTSHANNENTEQREININIEANPKNVDVHAWLRGNEVPSLNQIRKGLDELRKIKVASSTFRGGVLSGKQLLLRDMIVNYVKDCVMFANGELAKQPDPLRLIVMGKPGAGKSFTIKQTLSDLQEMFPGDKDWEQHIKTCAPSGAAAFQLGFGATTVHSRFKIKVANMRAPLSSNELVDFVQELGPGVKLIVFDEMSMLGREIFAVAMERLKQAGHKCDSTGLLSEVGFVFVGDPAQILPVGGQFLWSPSLTVEKGTEPSRAPADIQEFRTQMLLKPLTKLTGYNEWIKLDKVSRMIKDDDMLGLLARFRFLSCYGDFKAVYLDQVRRVLTDDPLAEEWLQVLDNVRYGHVSSNDIKFMRDNFATENDIKNDTEWKERLILRGYHYYKSTNPDRLNVQSENAMAIIRLADEYDKPVFKFTAYHDPPEERHRLSTVCASEYRNLQSNLWFFEGVRVMLLSNISPPVKLFNGALHKYVGPLYLNKVFELKVDSTKVNKCLNNDVFVEPLPARGTTFKQIPVGSTLLSVDGNRPPTLPREKREITIRVEMPNKPPSLPDFQVVNVEGYKECGGPNIIGYDFTQNLVPIELVSNERCKSGKKSRKTSFRTNTPLECGISFTSFKVQGATVPRVELGLGRFVTSPGAFLAAITRVKSPKHNYVTNNQFPSAHDLKMQRLNRNVLAAECCELMVRVIAAKTLREYCQTEGNPYGFFWSVGDNLIANQIHCHWLAGLEHAQTVTPTDVVRTVARDLNRTEAEVLEVYTKMADTDEVLLTRAPPTLTRSEIEELVALKNNRAPPSERNDSEQNPGHSATRGVKRNRKSDENRRVTRSRATRRGKK